MIRIDRLPGIQVDEDMEDVVRKAAEKALLVEESEDCEVSIFLTDDDEIHRLNKIYRGVDRPTDVLAFAMREGLDGELNREILGDVVVSLPRAEEQAGIHGHSLQVEMSLLVSHGVLHLLGYEHDQRDNLLVMQQKQRDILHLLGHDLAGLEDGLECPANEIER
jgi:probable rRNA maturation factor